MLGIKFLTHAASYFFKDEIGGFNDRVTDLGDVMGNSIKILHNQLLETEETAKRIELVENFLLKKLGDPEKRSFKFDKVANILASIKTNPTENNITNIAFNYGIT